MAPIDHPKAKPAPFPTDVISPQLAVAATEPPTGDRWLHEIKYDGYRILAYRSRATRLVSRNGKDWTDKLAAVVPAIEGLPAKQFILDGEIVVFDQAGASSFQMLQNSLGVTRASGLAYVVFDLLHCDGFDLTLVPLVDRKAILRELLTDCAPAIQFSDHIEGNGNEILRQICSRGLEGIVSKRRDKPYRNRRHADWVKVKCLQREEFTIVGFTESTTVRGAIGALALAMRDHSGALVYVGKVGSGFTQRSMEMLRERMKTIRRKDSPLVSFPKGKEPIRWVEPTLVADVQFMGWTGEHLRHPVFKGLRDEDSARGDDVRSTPASSVDAESVGIPDVRLTHPDRVLVPDLGITKLDLAPLLLCDRGVDSAFCREPTAEHRVLSRWRRSQVLLP
jgi:bifunctional non-homologous end joining protein LigD